MANKIQLVTVGAEASVATNAVVRNGDYKDRELVLHLGCQG